MNLRGKSAAPVVERQYLPKPDACERALRTLLKNPISKAVEPALEPNGRDVVKESNGHDVTRSIPRNT